MSSTDTSNKVNPSSSNNEPMTDLKQNMLLKIQTAELSNKIKATMVYNIYLAYKVLQGAI